MLIRLHNSISLHLRVLDKKDGKFLASVFRINLKLHNSSFYDYHSMILELKFSIKTNQDKTLAKFDEKIKALVKVKVL